MPTITFDGQSLLIDNRRIWLVGASLDYARIPNELWADRIAAAKQAGFNTISVACPWMLHEPRPGRFDFDGPADVRTFVDLCREAGMYVVLRAGPFVGSDYDGGGLPSWLTEMNGIRLREANEIFVERIALYFRKLLAGLVDLQMTRSRKGCIVAVQAEQSWYCTNPATADAYLGEVMRHLRENGVTVPILTANDLWAEAEGATETWTGEEALLDNLRQFRAIQEHAPRIVSAFTACQVQVWGDAVENNHSPRAVLHNFAQVLAAGAQPIVRPFHGGTNFAFSAGRRAGRTDGFVGTAHAIHAPLGEAGSRGHKYDHLKRLATFASHFGAVFAELDPTYQPITIDLNTSSQRGDSVSVVPLRGSRGRIAFVFGATTGHTATTLLLDNGLSLPVDLGDQPVGWYLFDADLGGNARLDYANLCPFALVDRQVLVLHGPEKLQAVVSINGSLVQATVPSGTRPVVMEHMGITLVICNQAQVDATYTDGKQVHVGCAGLATDGTPLPRNGFNEIVSVGAHAETTIHKSDTGGRRPPMTKLGEWVAAPAVPQTTGTSPRYASLAGPETLDSCGTNTGYGWYRVSFKNGLARKRLVAIPESGVRLHLYAEGEFLGIVGDGPEAIRGPFELKLPKGDVTIVGLADHTGRFCEGNDLARKKGWYGHMLEVSPMKVGRPKTIDAEPLDALALRPFLIGQSKGRLTESRHLLWKFTHRKKSPVLLSIQQAFVSGVFILNDVPLAYFAGPTSDGAMDMLLDPEKIESMKRGNNELRFAPDAGYGESVDELLAHFKLLEVVDAVTSNAKWSFARWEPPVGTLYEDVSKTGAKSLSGRPCWWRSTFDVRSTELPLWFDTTGLSKGQVFINGRNLGRYFTTTAGGKKVGPQTKLYVPETWVKTDESNEIVVFDEHGCDPFRTTIIYHAVGDLDEPV